MRGFATSSNPYLTGIQPRSFFSARVAMLKREQMMKTVDRGLYPKLQGEKKSKS